VVKRADGPPKRNAIPSRPVGRARSGRLPLNWDPKVLLTEPRESAFSFLEAGIQMTRNFRGWNAAGQGGFALMQNLLFTCSVDGY